MTGSPQALVAPGIGWAFGCSRVGASHRRADRPCQDAFQLCAGAAAASPYLAAAVADGHGGSAHDRSEVGADLAVRAAADEWQRLLTASCAVRKDLSPQPPPRGGEGEKETLPLPSQGRRLGGEVAFPTFQPADLIGSFRTGFAGRLARRWREAVAEDARRRDPDGPFSLRRYGTTLLTALLLPGHVLLAQIGDGDALLLRPDGDPERPLRGSEGLIGSETYSLAGDDVPLRMRTAVLERGGGGLLLLATDGLGDSLAPGGLERFAEAVRRQVHEAGMAAVAGAQPAWLDHFSEGGSGDDVTLVVVGFPGAERGARSAELRTEEAPSAAPHSALHAPRSEAVPLQEAATNEPGDRADHPGGAAEPGADRAPEAR